jgi:hypothetical protein
MYEKILTSLIIKQMEIKTYQESLVVMHTCNPNTWGLGQEHQDPKLRSRPYL